MLTDQGILGHIIRENDYKVNTLTQKISLSHHNIINSDKRYQGKAEKWYDYVNKDKEKEVAFDHIWLDKINTQNMNTHRWFKELIEVHNLSHVLDNDVRWNKYWIHYHENN